MSGQDELSLPTQLALVACLLVILFALSYAVTTMVA